MNIKKKYFKAIAGLGAGAVLLTCAVFANYDNANSYTNCKNALKSLLYADNMSIDYTAELKVDDQKVGAYYGGWKMNINGDPAYRYENTHEFGDNMNYDLNQLQGDIEINKVVASHGGTHAYYYNNGGYKPGTAIEQISGGEGSDFGDKLVGFCETVGDVLVGDLKNNFVMTESKDGVSRYSVSLTKDQMPAYVNSGVSLIASVITSNMNTDNVSAEDETDPETRAMLAIFGSGEPYVKNAEFNMSVDENQHPGDIKCVINFSGYDKNGGEHNMTLTTDFSFYDFGNTSIDPIPADEIQKMDNMDKCLMYKTDDTSDNGDDTMTID